MKKCSLQSEEKIRNDLKFTIGLFQREVISMQKINSLRKPNQMSKRKCWAVFRRTISGSWHIVFKSSFTFDLVRNANFGFLMTAQITHKWINLHRPLYA